MTSLDAIIERLNKLPIKVITMSPDMELNSIPLSTNALLTRILQQIKLYHYTSNTKQATLFHNSEFVIANISNYLQQAQWYLLQHNEVLFHQSINTALQKLNNPLLRNNNDYNALTQSLYNLSKIQIIQKNIYTLKAPVLFSSLFKRK